MRHIWKVFCLTLTVLLGTVQASELPAFKEGEHYEKFSKKIYEESSVDALFAKDKGKIQVVEFFSYACHWCNQLDTKMSDWYSTKKAKELALRRVPVLFRPTWRPLAKAYFTAEALQITPRAHAALFEQVQVLHTDMSTDDAVRTFFINELKVSAEDFDAHYQSFSLNRELENSNALLKVYKIMAVPTVVVNGPSGAYSTTLARAGGEEQFFALLDFLVEKARTER